MVLGDAAADFDDRRFLERIGADDLGADLAGDRDQRNAVELGVGDGRDQVRRAGSARGHAHARLAGAAGNALGGEPAALFVPGQDRSEPVGKPRERLVQRHARPARVGENRVDAVVDQRLNQDIGPAGELGLGLGLTDSRHGDYLGYGKRWFQLNKQGHDGAAQVHERPRRKPIHDKRLEAETQERLGRWIEGRFRVSDVRR